MKKLNLLLLVLFSAISLNINAYDFVEGSIYYNITSSTNRTVELTYESINSYIYSGTINIPSTVSYNGKTYNVTSIGDYAFEWCKNLTSVTIPNSVTTIGRQAFYGCRGLTSVAIPNSVTSIGYEAFERSGLTSVTIGNSVTSIESNAFEVCSSLTGVYINDLTAWCNIDFGNSYANPLYYTRKLYLNGTLVRNLEIPEGVTAIKECAFENLKTIRSVGIPNSVTSIGNYAFRGCSSLTSVTISNSVTSIGNDAFSGCSSLTSVTIPNSVTYQE